MNSGLYAFAGASATATAAACANRFDCPMTKLSNEYFGFRRASRGRWRHDQAQARYAAAVADLRGWWFAPRVHVGDFASAAREVLNKSDNERSGVLSTAMSFLGLSRDPVYAVEHAVTVIAMSVQGR